MKKIEDFLYCPGDMLLFFIRIKLFLLLELPGPAGPLSLFLMTG